MGLSNLALILPLVLSPLCSAQARLDFVNIHNTNRYNHQVGELTWDDTLEDYASQMVNQCLWNPELDDTNYGFARAVMPDEPEFGGIGLEVIILTNNLWYSQRQNYHYYAAANTTTASDYAGPPMDEIEKWGNFTQMVWKGTDRFGCSVRKCGMGVMVPDREAYNIACVYSPMGNVAGKFGENVFEFKLPG